MTLKLYDLCGSNADVRFSPFCWRSKLALKHKGLDFDAVPWRFTDKDAIAFSGQGRVPVLVDTAHDDKTVSDSWSIATYLDEAYPDRPMLMKDEAARAAAKTIQAWTDGLLFVPLRPIAVKRVWDLLDPNDQTYFRETREAALKQPLEEVSSEAAIADGYKKLGQTLRTIEPTLTDHAFLGGAEPFYGDYVVFGTLMWAHAILPNHSLDADTASAAWFERMLDLYGGYARNAPRAAA
ncbi:MAG: glutathione S-transferase N-terminal domain-containing protein [Pseudomonadota bacterium]